MPLLSKGLDMTTTFEQLRTILVRDYKLDPDMVTLDAELEALGIDSLGVAELLFNVEDEFHITLSPDAVQVLTLGDVVQFIDELIAVQHGSKSQKDEVITSGLQAT
jgi:acyl carrier protein